MAKVNLKAGAAIDILSTEEHRQIVDRLRQDFEKYFAERDGTTDVQAAPPFTLDSSGDGSGTVYRVPAGYHAYLLRCSFDYAGSNASSPDTCDVRVVADANTPSSLRAINNQLPSVFDASRSHAPMFRQGQQIVVSVTGGPASTSIYCTPQVLLVLSRKVTPVDVETAL